MGIRWLLRLSRLTSLPNSATNCRVLCAHQLSNSTESLRGPAVVALERPLSRSRRVIEPIPITTVFDLRSYAPTMGAKRLTTRQ